MNANKGFSLIEMAVVLVIVVLLLGGLLVPLEARVGQARVNDTEKTLEEIKEALVGYALRTNRLPCPDKTTGPNGGPNDAPNDGAEDFNSGTGSCITQEGNLPWLTLGIEDSDSWGRVFHYRVTASFSNRPPATTLTLSSAGDIRVCRVAGCSATAATANDAAALVLSYGDNGTQTLTCPNAARADECENLTPEAVAPYAFVSRTLTAAGSPAGEFDDIATWLSPNILFNRMVAAGRLPQ